MNAVARKAGRYNDRSRAFDPGDLPRQGKRGQMHIVHGVVDDPTSLAKEKLGRQKVAINRDTDALENEYFGNRISQDAYDAARTYQRVMAANTSPTGGGQWLQGDRVDVMVAQESGIVAKLESARRKVDISEEVRSLLGWRGELLMRVVLVDRQSLTSAAMIVFGAEGKRAVSHCAWAFRQNCEDLGKKASWMAQGRAG